MKLRNRLTAHLSIPLASAFAMMFTAPSAFAQTTYDWSADSDGAWTTAGNWQAGVVPTNVIGDVINLTPNNTANRIFSVDDGVKTLGILNIGDSDNTHAITLNTGSPAGSLLMNNGVNPSQINEAGSVVDTINANIALTNNLAVSAGGSLFINGVISESVASSLTKTGAGTLTLSGANSYTGGTSITEGIIAVSNGSALGTGDVTFNGGARLLAAPGTTIANNIVIGTNSTTVGAGTLAPTGVSSASPSTFSGNITINNLAAAGGHFSSNAGNRLVLSGVITSSVIVSQRGGNVTFSGGGTGYTALDVTGNITVGATNGIATTAIVDVGRAGDGTLDLNGFNQTLSGVKNVRPTSVSTIGNSSTTSDSILTINGGSNYTGTIRDVLGAGTRTVGVTVAGGAFSLGGANTYTGATSVNAGSLVVNGSISTSITTVATGATLAGTGTVGAVTVSGILAPGFNSIATLTAVSDVTWNSNNAWVFGLGNASLDLASADTGGTRDLLAITGANSDFLKGTGSAFTFDFANGGAEGFYKLVEWDGTTDFVSSDFVATNLGGGLTGSYIVDASTSALYLSVIPEPSAALLGSFGLLALLRRRR